MKHIPLSEPVFEGNEKRYLIDSIESGVVSSVGKYVTMFENSVSKILNIDHSIACINGTSALHLALRKAGVGCGDLVVVPNITFIATANVVRYLGADPVFIDCDQETLCVDPVKLRIFIETNCDKCETGVVHKNSRKFLKAIVPVHIFGHPVDMDPVLELADYFGLTVIEDCAEALGSMYKDRACGTMGIASCLSFNGNKIITSGGGGMVVTSNKIWADQIRHLSTQAKLPGREYDHDAVGYNYRLSNLHAAVGLAQIERLDYVLKVKRENALRYRELLANVDELTMIWEQKWARSNFWFYGVLVPTGRRDKVIEYMAQHGVEVRPLWKPMHTQSMFHDCFCGELEVSSAIYEQLINIPCSINLRPDHIKRVVDLLKVALVKG